MTQLTRNQLYTQIITIFVNHFYLLQQIYQIMSSSKISVSTQQKRCQGYVKKLNRQIQTIGDQVGFFNTRQSNINNQSCRTRCNLKRLSQPKLQRILLQKQFNPEHPKIEPNTKISKFFRNCSTFTQNDFAFVNHSLLIKGTESLLFQKTKANENLSEVQKKINKKLKVLERSWNKIQHFRIINDLNQPKLLPLTDKKTRCILERVEKKRPQTTNTARSKIIDSAAQSFYNLDNCIA